VTAGGPGLVAVGRDSVAVGSETYRVAAVWTSPDGFTWSRVAHDDAVFGRATGLPDDIFKMTAVTAGGPGLVAVGERGGASDQVEHSGRSTGGWMGTRPVGAVWTSVDGVTWSRVPHDPNVFGEWEEDQGPVSEPMHGLSAQMKDVTTGGPGLVVVGDVYRGGWGTGRGAAWTSPDGFTWALATEDIEAVARERQPLDRILQMIEDGRGFIALTHGRLRFGFERAHAHANNSQSFQTIEIRPNTVKKHELQSSASRRHTLGPWFG
jgi:hypothetical protein